MHLVGGGGGGGGGKQREVFTVLLTGLKLDSRQESGQRDIDFQINTLQVEMQGHEREMILKNTTEPFLSALIQRDTTSTLDVRLKQMVAGFGELEVCLNGEVLRQGLALRRSLMFGRGGLSMDEVKTRAELPYHRQLEQPFPASPKLVLNKLALGYAKIDVWCGLYLPDAHYMPKSMRDAIQVVTNRLDIKGAQVKLPQQTLFSPQKPGEGSIGSVAVRVSDHYLPYVKASWRSLLQHSNLFLGGLLSRHTWAPRQRRPHQHLLPLTAIGSSGELLMPEPHRPNTGAGGAGSGAGAGAQGRGKSSTSAVSAAVAAAAAASGTGAAATAKAKEKAKAHAPSRPSSSSQTRLAASASASASA
mmetsp:Transcript_22282/g.48725  ORF Transcript_22282/g.48725 Transcript_22282/m.48725 type:complete len:360 (-) Transcript_22282:466-1545(-)